MTEPKIEEEIYTLQVPKSHLDVIAQALGQVMQAHQYCRTFNFN